LNQVNRRRTDGVSSLAGCAGRLAATVRGRS
jgi:hypothetical protein